MADKPSKLKIADREFASRLLVGTGKFSSNEVMRDALDCEWHGDRDRRTAPRRSFRQRRSVRKHSRLHRPETVSRFAEHERRAER